MPRTIVLALAVLFTVTPITWGLDLAEIKSQGTLRVIALMDDPPEMFSFSLAGEPGFSREMIEGFARVRGLKVELVSVRTPDERIRALQRDEGDLVTGIVVTEARKTLVAFTDDVLPNRHLVVTRKPRGVVTTVEAFRAEKVGVTSGTSWAQAAIEAGIPAAKLDQYPSRNALLEAIKAGRITATVMSIVDFTLAAKRDPELQAGMFVGSATGSAWAVRKSDTQLLAALNEYLGYTRKAMTWHRLVVKYFGEQALTILDRVRQQDRRQ